MTTPVSGIIFAKNEEALIGQAVESLKQLADEVVVADMASTDRTAETALRHGARVVQVPDFGYVEPARPLVEAECRFDWVANIDADEILPRHLVDVLADIVERDEADAVKVSRLNLMLGSPVRAAGWGPESDRLIRFYRKGSLQHSTAIHQSPRVSDGARVVELPTDDDVSIWHFNYRGWDHFLEKLNRYTSIEALERSADASPLPTPLQLGKTLARTFKHRYWNQRGFRDGYRGFTLSALMVTYQLMVYAKTRQLAELGDDGAIAERYRRIAAETSPTRESASA